MTARTFDELFEPALRLTLHRSTGGYWSVTDQDGRLFTPPSENVAFHVRFMTAMAKKGDAVVDERSVERLIEGIGWFSLKVPGPSAGPEGHRAGAETVGSGPPLAPLTSGVEGHAADSPAPDSTSPKLRLVL